MRRSQTVDIGSYFRALGLYVRNPSLVLAPLAMALAGALLTHLINPSQDTLGQINAGLAGLIAQLFDGFGLGVALIVADLAWRRGRAPFDEAWNDAQRKAPDLLLATLGFGFLIFAASLVGGFLGPFGSLLLSLLAFYFFIYTFPAAAIGGIPGGAALQVSIERAQRKPLATAVLAIVSLIVYVGLGLYAPLVIATQVATAPIVQTLIAALCKALAIGYIALVLSKGYNDASYGRVY